MTHQGAPAARWSQRTAWARNIQTPLRDFLRTETGSAVVLLAATLAALGWANLDPSCTKRRGERSSPYASATRRWRRICAGG